MANRHIPRAPRLTIHVTEELIEEAIPKDSGHCLYAEAVKAAYPDAKRVAVDLQTIRFTDPKKGVRFTYLTPRPLQISLIQFDQGVRPQPHRVQLRNGQVTNSGTDRVKRGRALTEETRKIRQDSAAQARAEKKRLRKATLRTTGTGAVPDKVGGKTPPVSIGRRRAFGLRAMDR